MRDSESILLSLRIKRDSLQARLVEIASEASVERYHVGLQASGSPPTPIRTLGPLVLHLGVPMEVPTHFDGPLRGRSSDSIDGGTPNSYFPPWNNSPDSYQGASLGSFFGDAK